MLSNAGFHERQFFNTRLEFDTLKADARILSPNRVGHGFEIVPRRQSRKTIEVEIILERIEVDTLNARCAEEYFVAGWDAPSRSMALPNYETLPIWKCRNCHWCIHRRYDARFERAARRCRNQSCL